VRPACEKQAIKVSLGESKVDVKKLQFMKRFEEKSFDFKKPCHRTKIATKRLMMQRLTCGSRKKLVNVSYLNDLVIVPFSKL